MSRRRRSTPSRPAARPSTPPSPPSGARYTPALVAAGLTALVLFVYAQTARFDFVPVDDPTYVSENPQVGAGLTASGLAWAFTTGHAANWHPLTWLSHMLDVQLFGMQPGAHHLVNVALHLASTLLLFWVFLEMTGALWPSAFVAAVFAIHPLHVESVAWVAERKDVLSTFFWMLTLWAYVRYVRGPTTPRAVAVTVALALGLMAKPMLVTLPFVLLLLDVWPLARTRGPRVLWREKLPLFALIVLSSVVTFIVQRQGGAMGELEQYPLLLRVENALVSYVAYLVKLVWPSPLTMIYPFPLTIAAWKVAGAAVVLASITLLCWRTRRTRPYLLVGWLWYIGTLIPVIGLVQVGLQAMADRYSYVPLVGVSIMIAWGAADLASQRRLPRAAVGVMAAAAIVGWTVMARAQTRYWQNGVVLWQHATETTLGFDKKQALLSVGSTLRKQGRINEAIANYQEAAKIDPADAAVPFELGMMLAQENRIDEAIEALRSAVRNNPKSADALHRLGLLLARQQRFEEATVAFANAVAANPAIAAAHSDYGLALLNAGRGDEAIKEFGEAVRLDPTLAEAHNNLGFALVKANRPGDALTHFEEAAKLKPDFEMAHRNLGLIYAGAGRLDDAIRELQTVIKLNPANAAAKAALDELIRRRQTSR